MPQDINRGLTGQDFSSPGGTSDVTQDLQQDAARLKDEAVRQGTAAMQQIREGARSLSEGAREQVSSVADQAKEQVSRYAETQKQAVTQHLNDFAEAIREASESLSQHDQTMASQVVRQAASGLESLSRSVAGANMQDMMRSVRNFGRDNPIAFLGGAMLAGLALGRFARASSPSRSMEQGGSSDWQRNWSGQSSGSQGYGRSWENDRFGQNDRFGGSEGMSPRPYGGSSYPAGESSSFAPASRAMGDYPAPSQGYAGGGMGTDPIQSSDSLQSSGSLTNPGPSSDIDASDTPSSTSGSSFSSGAISTGEDS